MIYMYDKTSDLDPPPPNNIDTHLFKEPLDRS